MIIFNIQLKNKIFLFLYSYFLRNKLGVYLLDLVILLRLKYYLLKTGTPSFDPLQQERYLKLRKMFESNYKNLKGEYQKFTTPAWEDYERELKKVLLPYPKISFLQEVPILKGMFATNRDEWLSKIENYPILKEDYIGKPLLYNKLISNNTIEHFNHILNFQKYVKTPLNTIVEWGGGYGNMAKLFWRMGTTTYIMIDLPIVCTLQWLYLSVIFGEDKVHLFQSPKDKIEKGKINIIPIFWANFHIKPDLFISTWALSESSKYSQDFVFQKKWFNARHLLLGFAKSSDRFLYSDRIGKLSKGKIVKINYLKGTHFYSFK